WAPVDILAMYGQLYAKTIEFEDESQKYKAIESDPSLAEFLPFVIPEENQNLLLPRPKLRRGQYPAVDLKKIEDALKELKKQGTTNAEMHNRNKLQGRFEDIGDLFTRGGAPQSGMFGGRGGGDDAGTSGGGGRGRGGDGRPPGGAPPFPG